GGSFPAHGFVRTMTWAVDAAEAGNDAAILRLAPVLGEEERKLWPEDAAVSVEIRAGADLQVTLSTENAGERALQITQALHTYLAVGNIEDVRVLGLDGRSFVDQLTREVRAQGGEIAIGEEVDRIYFDTANEVVVRDES